MSLCYYMTCSVECLVQFSGSTCRRGGLLCCYAGRRHGGLVIADMDWQTSKKQAPCC